MTERERLQDALLRRAAAGQLDAKDAVRVLAPSGAPGEGSGEAGPLMDWLDALETPEADSLANALCPERCAQIRRCRALELAGEDIPADLAGAVAGLPPLPESSAASAPSLPEMLIKALNAQRDRLALRAMEMGKTDELANEPAGPEPFPPDLWTRWVRPRDLAAQLLADPSRWEGRDEQRQVFESCLADTLAEPMRAQDTAEGWRVKLRACPNRNEARAHIDRLCLRPVEDLARILPRALEESWQQRRAVLLLAWQTGREDVIDWASLCQWLAREAERARRNAEELERLRRARPAELLLLWHRGLDDSPERLGKVLKELCAGAVARVSPADLLARYGSSVSPEERQRLEDAAKPPPLPPTITAPAPKETPPVEAEEPAAPPEPSVWQQYMRPFLTENWLLVAGILGVLAGVSVLVYRYWESTWLVRYSVVQSLLVGGVLVPAKVGTWLERKEERLRDTALVLRGAAMLLVPVNILCPLMLASGNTQPLARILAPLFGALLLGGLGWWLRRTLLKLTVRVGPRLPWALTSMHGLAFLALLAMSTMAKEAVSPVLAALPFLLLLPCAWCIRTFPHREGDEEPPKQLAPLVTVLLAGTFLQLVGWAHLVKRVGFAGEIWALAAILAGGLILLAEYRFACANGSPERHASPAFAGFAVILLGLLLSLPHAYVRPVAFLLAGVVWTVYGAFKRHPAHAWAGTFLSALGIVSVAFVPAYPVPWRPAVAVLVALVLEPSLWRRPAQGYKPLLSALADVQSTFAGAAIVAAILSQFHYRNEAWITLVIVLAATACLVWFAYRGKTAGWTFLAAMGAACALPYAGFADTMGLETANTMAFGLGALSWAWIALVGWGRRPTYLRQPRSTVLTAYGCLAMMAMLIRLVAQRMSPDAGTVWHWMDTAGPILVIAALALATYWSRSLLPASMAAFTGAIFAPEMRTVLEEAFPRISWDSGVGSACWALLLIAVCFRLRDDARLRDLGPGDRSWGDRPFPWLRQNHTLFTLPAILTTVFLCLRLETLVWITRILSDKVLWPTYLALALSGVAWLACAVYLHRDHPRFLRICAYLGVFWLGAGALLLCSLSSRLSAQLVLLGFCAPIQLTHALGLWTAKLRFDWALETLVKPTRRTLMVATLLLLSGSAVQVWDSGSFAQVYLLAGFCVVQLVWHGLRTRHSALGWLLFPYVVLMSASAWLGGDQTLTSSGLHEMALGPLLVLIVTLVLATAAERLLPVAFERGAALLKPWLLGSGVLAILVGGLMLGYSIFPGDMTMTHFWCAAASIVLAARSNGWSLPALLPLTAGAALLALLGVPRDSLPDVIEAIQEPWKLSLLACALLACTHGGRWIHRRWPTLFVSEHAPKPIPSTIPFTAFGVALALTGLVEHVAAPVYRDAVAQVGTPFLSACALAAAGLALGATFVVPFLTAAGLSVGIGTVLAVRVFAGPWLRPLGANEVHLVVIGLALNVILTEAVAAACRKRWGSQTFRWGCAMPAALVPTLLAIGYAYRPGLAHTNSVRCLVSGLCALVAAAPFRRFRDQEGEAPLAIGLPISLALGIAALSMAIPGLRQPDWALTALLLPPTVLLLLNQVDKGAPESCRRATGDVVFWLVAALLVLQLVPAFHQLLCFAGPRSWLGHFHAHALVPLGGGMILALLGKWQKHQPAAYLSGILLAMGGYAVVAQWPLIWAFPRSFPMAATVWLLIWAHVCVALAGAKGFHRWLIGPEAADGVGLLWRTFVCFAAQAVVLAVIGTGTLSTYASAPLLAGAASLLVHTVAYGAPRWVGAVALLELLASIHLDFVTPSYLPKDMVIWVLLGTWAALLLADRLLRNRIRQATAAASQALVVFALAHVWYCDPGTPTGLVGMGLAALLYALSPLREPTETAPEGAPDPLLFLVPAWLLFWGVRGAASLAVEPPTLVRASLAAAGGLLLTTPLTVWQNPDRLLALWHQRRPIATRRVDAALLWVQTHAQRADMGALIFASLACLAACMYPNLGLANTALAVALLALLAWGWWRTARRQQDASCVVVALAALLLIPYAIRSHLLATEHWQPEWDIWAVLALSSILCLFAQWFSRQEPYARIPLLALFWGLPILNIVWLSASHLWGSDLPLLVTAIHSIQFGYLGRNDRTSPFRAGAVVGAVAFCLVAFGLRLQLRHAYAYVVPIGMGILVLLRLFGGNMEAKDRNTVRTIVLLSMLGSTAYYVVADSHLRLIHILALGLLCLFSMGVAAFTRTRAYLYLGFTGFVVDLIALLYRVLVQLERGAVMTLVGVLVLGGGIALVTGSIYYKMHREDLLAKLRHASGKLGDWE